MKKEKSTLLDKLKENLPVDPKEIEKSLAKLDKQIIIDTEDDVEFVRSNIKNALEKAADAVESAAILAQDADHPRAIESLGTLLKAFVDSNEKLIDLQKKRKDIVKQEKGENNTESVNGKNLTQTNVYIGDTASLQKQIQKEREAKDVTNSTS